MPTSPLGIDQADISRDGVDKLADTFFPVYERFLKGDVLGLERFVGRKIAGARRGTTVELFLSRALGYGILSGVGLWLVVTVLTTLLISLLNIQVGTLVGFPIENESVITLLETLRMPFLILTTGLVFGTLGFSLGFGSPLLKLHMDAGSRGREIDILLPDAVAFMYALAIGGQNQLEILEAMAKAGDTYGEISSEFEVILQETRYFGVDYRTAIRNRALETPSDELGQFLTDMLSILNSGGDMGQFLDDKKSKYMRTSTEKQEQSLEMLELFGEMYMTLALFPLLLIILLVIMTLIGSSSSMFMFLTVYGLIPLTGIIFLVLIATVKQDDPGDGWLIPDEDDPYIMTSTSALKIGIIEQFNEPYEVLDTIRRREGTHIVKNMLIRPDKFLMENPIYTFAISIPLSIVLLSYAAFSGIAPTSWEAWKQSVIWGTILWIYLPMWIIAGPYAIAYTVDTRRRRGIVSDLSENLRKLASANDTGQTLLEAFQTVSDTSRGKIAKEFEIVYHKVNYGISMKQALIEFNNKYHLPRLSRTIKLITKAQETSSNITPVLKTAASTSEQADKLEREQKSRSRMQIVIIVMTYLTLLVVMIILKVQFLDVMANLTQDVGSSASSGGAGGVSFNGVDSQKLSLLFFHAVTIQGMMASMISGYLRTGKLQSGVKWLMILPTIALIVWSFA